MWLLLNSHHLIQFPAGFLSQQYPTAPSMLTHRLNLLLLPVPSFWLSVHYKLCPQESVTITSPLQLQNTPSLSRLFMFLPYWELSLLHYFIWFLANTSLAPAFVCREKKTKKKTEKTHPLAFQRKGSHEWMSGMSWVKEESIWYNIVQIRQENRKLLDIS